jgi:hypothetical protein
MIHKSNLTEIEEDKEENEKFHASPNLNLFSDIGKTSVENHLHHPMTLSEQISKKIIPVIEVILESLVQEPDASSLDQPPKVVNPVPLED